MPLPHIGLRDLFAHYLKLSDTERHETFLTTEEAARLSDCKPCTVCNWFETGRVQAIRLGRRKLRVYKPSLLAFLAECEQQE